jgi:hypothetical protein
MSTTTTFPLTTAEAIILECQIRTLELREKLQNQVDAMEDAEAAELEHFSESWRNFLNSKTGRNMSVTDPRISAAWPSNNSTHYL